MDWRIRFRYVIWYRIKKPFEIVGRFLSRVFTIYRVAAILALTALAIWYVAGIGIDELLPNIVPELLSIALTIFVIDTIYRHRSDTQLKKALIEQLGSKNNAVASRAVEELQAQGWLSDGTLRKASLLSANLEGNSFTGADMRGVNLSFASLKDTTWFEADLEGAFLDHADLRDARLSTHAVGPHYAEANLKGATMAHSDLTNARVRDEQLVQLRSLWRATMSNGKVYDGRYNLPYDIELHEKHARDTDDTDEWAQFYGVSNDEYLRGQAWAATHPEFFADKENSSSSG